MGTGERERWIQGGFVKVGGGALRVCEGPRSDTIEFPCTGKEVAEISKMDVT